ncbi:Ent-kaurene oxidase, partial [Linum grandiflorum]
LIFPMKIMEFASITVGPPTLRLVASIAAVVVGFFVSLYFMKRLTINQKMKKSKLNLVPGSNYTHMDDDAMVTKFSSISSRKLPKALMLLSQGKSTVALSDYDDFHKMAKRHLLNTLLSSTVQKRHYFNRVIMVDNITSQLHAHAKANPGQAFDFRKIFEHELFSLSMREVIGKEVESVYVKELEADMSREEIFKILVLDPLDGCIEVDWREFFPFMRWIPNGGFEERLEQMHFRRDAVAIDCYIDHLLSSSMNLTDLQIRMLIWEVIVEASDSTLVATEWAMYELAKNPKCQERLFQYIQDECGSEKLDEQHLSKLPYLTAIFHETLRRHTPVPVIPLRHVDEDIELGGYHVPAGTEIAINLYGCNMDGKQWENPEEWLPERFLNSGSDPMEIHKTMAFGGGKRACAGAFQAMLTACTSIGRMVQDFEWMLRDGEEDNEDTVSLTARKLEPLHTIIKPRC